MAPSPTFQGSLLLCGSEQPWGEHPLRPHRIQSHHPLAHFSRCGYRSLPLGGLWALGPMGHTCQSRNHAVSSQVSISVTSGVKFVSNALTLLNYRLVFWKGPC